MTTLSTVYLLWAKDTCFFKIGRSKDMANRISSLQTGCPTKIVVAAEKAVLNAHSEEARLHKKWSDYRLHGEWFEFSRSALIAVMQDFGITAALTDYVFCESHELRNHLSTTKSELDAYIKAFPLLHKEANDFLLKVTDYLEQKNVLDTAQDQVLQEALTALDEAYSHPGKSADG
jgi:hypothetical protein